MDFIWEKLNFQGFKGYSAAINKYTNAYATENLSGCYNVHLVVLFDVIDLGVCPTLNEARVEVCKSLIGLSLF